jgi:hypothetical protein
MRYFLGVLILSCCAVTGYSDEVAVDETTEVSTADDSGSGEVAVTVDSLNGKGGGCGCGNKPKI